MAREAYEAAQKVEDVNERRRQAAIPLRDMRYPAERVRTAQVVADPVSADSIAFGSKVTFSRADGRVQIYRIVEKTKQIPRQGRFPTFLQSHDCCWARRLEMKSERRDKFWRLKRSCDELADRRWPR